MCVCVRIFLYCLYLCLCDLMGFLWSSLVLDIVGVKTEKLSLVTAAVLNFDLSWKETTTNRTYRCIEISVLIQLL